MGYLLEIVNGDYAYVIREFLAKLVILMERCLKRVARLYL